MDNKHSNKHGRGRRPDEEINAPETFDNLGEAAAEGAPDPTAENEQEELIESQEDELGKLRADLDTMQAALEKEKKEYLFLMAEFDNFRKRTVKEKADIIRNASGQVLEKLLPIVDDFERGLEAMKESHDDDPARQGMTLIYNKLMKFLEQHGVKPIESTGREFDPDLHEAIAMVPAPDEGSHNRVIDTPTRGYTLNDKVLRHAKVVVAQ